MLLYSHLRIFNVSEYFESKGTVTFEVYNNVYGVYTFIHHVIQYSYFIIWIKRKLGKVYYELLYKFCFS